MPISDLLAEISGGQSSAAPSAKPTTSSARKRKAEDDSSTATSTKLTKARQSDGSYASSKITRNEQGDVTERSYSMSRPVKTAASTNSIPAKSLGLPHRTNSPSINGRYESPTTSSQRLPPSSNGKPLVGSSSGSRGKPSTDSATHPKLNSTTMATSRVPPAKPSPTTPIPSDPSRPPKKGSFAEIMARGAKAQQTMGKVGMIQHKAIDKKKEREVVRAEQKPGIKGKPGAPGTPGRPYVGNAGRPGAREPLRNGSTKDLKAGGKQISTTAAEDVQEKKIKKSAVATTGYTGTARPRPGAAKSKASTSRESQRARPSQPGGILAPPRPSRRDRYEEEEDEELDDFIEYDDEDEPGPRGNGYGYDSDASSDMEAGLSDIDVEEQRAAAAAREEDRREQLLEAKLKREKEERKRRFAQSGR
ncbi:Uu.00g016070.m01.CDS01 [Anthostomella pinea]|uniref:Uu.00g016070.m01.CDS01 n=1 Tax=Anthostomella pinea TaxID=933095 RepID=A0AAI8YQF3_9PEZI|nr:Uu.00g016070.m01.CDS01 [Anthostomella pinea]